MASEEQIIIQMWRDNPILWDRTLPGNKNWQLKGDARKEIAAAIGKSVVHVQQKLKNLNDAYVKARKRMTNGHVIKPGTRDDYLLQKLSFLLPSKVSSSSAGTNGNGATTDHEDIKQEDISQPSNASEQSPVKQQTSTSLLVSPQMAVPEVTSTQQQEQKIQEPKQEQQQPQPQQKQAQQHHQEAPKVQLPQTTAKSPSKAGAKSDKEAVVGSRKRKITKASKNTISSPPASPPVAGGSSQQMAALCAIAQSLVRSENNNTPQNQITFSSVLKANPEEDQVPLLADHSSQQHQHPSLAPRPTLLPASSQSVGVSVPILPNNSSSTAQVSMLNAVNSLSTNAPMAMLNTPNSSTHLPIFNVPNSSSCPPPSMPVINASMGLPLPPAVATSGPSQSSGGRTEEDSFAEYIGVALRTLDPAAKQWCMMEIHSALFQAKTGQWNRPRMT